MVCGVPVAKIPIGDPGIRPEVRGLLRVAGWRGRDHVVERGERLGGAVPAEVLAGEGGGADGEAGGERRIGVDCPDGGGDAGGVRLVEHEGLDAVADNCAEVGARQDHGAAGGEEFGKLRGETVVVERI